MNLSESDIPGAALNGRLPAQLKVEELRFWLRCRGDNCKGLKTKAQFIKRVEEYINSGQDKNIVDPDEDKIYTKRKRRQSEIRDATGAVQKATSVAYPNDGWSTNLERMPLFSKAEMNLHISKTGKQIDPSIAQHSVPTGLRKAKTFLEDEYLKNIMATSNDKLFFFKCQCYHSYRKTDAPHQLRIALDLVSAEVIHACCSCVAGKVGFCNHTLALMMQICKFTLQESKDTRELNSEEDMQPKVACTSSLQLWHKVGRSEKIQPKPVMDLLVKKTKLNETRTSNKPAGLRCLIYEARNNISTQKNDEVKLKAELMSINPNMALSQIMSPSDKIEYVETKFGKSPKGSYASYQLSFTESNFSVFCDIDELPRTVSDPSHVHTDMQYPRFPLQEADTYILPQDISDREKQLLEYLSVDEDKLNNLEKKTQGQSHCEMWKDERRLRLTASNFQRICCRQRNHDTLVESLLNPTTFTSRFTLHGQTHEPIALRQYEKYMFTTRRPLKLFKSGLVVCSDAPFVGASPDGKVIDVGCEKPFGLVEVKCPETKFHVTPLEACSDPAFCCENVQGQPKLKVNHPYYYQVQGQMGVTKAHWCDFVIYTSMGMSIQRIKPEKDFWNSMQCKLKSFYFNHYLKKAADKYHTTRQN